MGTRNPFRHQRRPRARLAVLGRGGPRRLRRLRRARPPAGPRGYDEFNQAKTAGNYGWPYCIADNKPYVAFDFATTPERRRPSTARRPVNNSPNNTGARTLPPARPAWIPYSYGGSRWGSGGRAAIAGAVYQLAAGRLAA